MLADSQIRSNSNHVHMHAVFLFHEDDVTLRSDGMGNMSRIHSSERLQLEVQERDSSTVCYLNMLLNANNLNVRTLTGAV